MAGPAESSSSVTLEEESPAGCPGRAAPADPGFAPDDGPPAVPGFDGPPVCPGFDDGPPVCPGLSPGRPGLVPGCSGEPAG
ncbi:hypothetical protein PW035_63555 [Nonomuraea angiospora]|nr:hypothetical protein [Nonomuraea angiospora]